MVLALSYRRPSHVTSSSTSLSSGDEKAGSINSGSTDSVTGIPDALSFDRVIAGGVCPVGSTVYHEIDNLTNSLS